LHLVLSDGTKPVQGDGEENVVPYN
ncbi:MAG: hypothetical protein RIR69_1383, partial [Actinomycetota bacterium]